MHTAEASYQGPAIVLAYDNDMNLIPGRTHTVTLAEAVKMIVEEWSGEQLVDVYIASETGPIEGIETIRGIYFRADFPLPRKHPAG